MWASSRTNIFPWPIPEAVHKNANILVHFGSFPRQGSLLACKSLTMHSISRLTMHSVTWNLCPIKFCSDQSDQGSAPTARELDLARSPFTNCSNCMARLVVLYVMNLPSLQHLISYCILMRNYFRNLTWLYYKCTVCCICAFVMNCENQELILLKFRSFNNILNSKGNGIVSGKLVQPIRHCRVCVWPTTRERLPTPELDCRFCGNLSLETRYVQVQTTAKSRKHRKVDWFRKSRVFNCHFNTSQFYYT